ncbi:hypothetical protein GCM10010844_39470 [Deinococcus radiotolerans]|uniref:HTH cro/C1-type domain-containing protein n=2 Tax=Deinococcus radiotolerans TaxID=1309407 RepID=A0ABQ2FQF4_9DEIO|nr:hypothetical protein GCM10010844_39470 [Deinococcus radiotolerans]
MSISAFAEAMGIHRSTLNDYLSGTIDIASISPKRAAAMILAMGVYDKDAWEILGLEGEARESFKTYRPAPAGHGPSQSTDEPITLPTPLLGEQPLPAGAKIYLDPAATDKVQVIRLEDGRYYSVTALLLQRAGGIHLGGLVRVDF